MRVTLAYPVDELGQPDETVDVDDDRARQLVRDGLARWPGSAAAAPAKSSTNKPRRPTGANTEEDTDGR